APKSSKSPVPAVSAADNSSPAEAHVTDAPTPVTGPVADTADKPAADKTMFAGARMGAGLVLGGAFLVIVGFLTC
ncbi:hypothetical protein MKX01_022851, partial [Papaver californicum]